MILGGAVREREGKLCPALLESQHLMQTSDYGIHLKLTLHFRNHFHHCAMTATTSAALECINKALKA